MSKPKEVFVVDDDKIYHFILKTFFKKNQINLNPVFFENGLEAVESLKQRLLTAEGVPDIILLDLNMPIMDGWQFLEEFKLLKKNHGFDIPVYVITSSNDNSDLEKAATYQSEISKYLLKPINESLLTALV
jgi:CheY-like chemotaxis protein